MNKIISFFDGIANFFGGIQSDKYAHLLVSLVATLVLGHIIHWFDTPMNISAGIGACAAMIIGFFKEWYDQFTDGDFSYADLFFDLVGCVLGLLVTIV